MTLKKNVRLSYMYVVFWSISLVVFIIVVYVSGYWFEIRSHYIKNEQQNKIYDFCREKGRVDLHIWLVVKFLGLLSTNQQAGRNNVPFDDNIYWRNGWIYGPRAWAGEPLLKKSSCTEKMTVRKWYLRPLYTHYYI